MKTRNTGTPAVSSPAAAGVILALPMRKTPSKPPTERRPCVTARQFETRKGKVASNG